MGKQLLLLAQALSNEKGVSIEVVFEAIQAALESATRKRHGVDMSVRVAIDDKTGDYQTFRYWDIVDLDDLEFPEHQLTSAEAKEEYDVDLAVGDRFEQPLESVEFGRIDAQAARQVIMQHVRDAERKLVVDQYIEKVGTLIIGTVKKTTRDNIIVDLGGKAEALLSRSDVLPQESFRPGDRVRSYLKTVEAQPRGPQLVVSRTCPEMLIELFRIEVPEIGEEVIDIKSAARDPGNRAKIAVKTNDGRIDPIGACVGMRGARVQAVSSELCGERVDIVLWDENPAQFVINAMAPAEISSIVVDEEARTMDLAVGQEYLSQAIGRNGQNVRLASDLTGWTLNVMTEEDFSSKTTQESEQVVQLFIDQLGVDEDCAAVLIEAGFTTLEEIAYVPKEELLVIEGFDEEIITELRSRANDMLLTKALASEEQEAVPQQDLLELDGMTEALAKTLAQQGIVSVEDLAEQSVDDLLEIIDLDKEIAGQLIMKAREPWFE